HEWIFDTVWSLYDDDSPAGFDIFAAACEAAHRHGMRFDAVIKPFEGAMSHGMALLPHTFPRVDGASLLDEPAGLIHAVRPFVAEHPEMRMARRPDDDSDPGGRIAAIRLVKNDDAPAQLGLDDLSIWTSPHNGGFEKYAGPVTLGDDLEWRSGYPYNDLPCRILTLGSLDLPARTRYILIRCRKREQDGNFINAIEKMVELVNEDGKIIPSMPSRSRVDAEGLYERTEFCSRIGLSRYTRLPEVRDLIKDREHFLKECADMFVFSSWYEDVALDSIGELAVSRGKPRQIYGALHPVYPEVRKHWLEQIKFCIDRGADGVNIRLANHNRPFEPWSYGFNAPVLERMEHPDNVAEARRINGEAYTQFLREAADLLHGQNKEMGIHVHGLFFHHNDTAANNTPLQCNIDWQWETWIRELADYVEMRGANMLGPENVREAADRIGIVTREAGIPFIFQCARSTKIVHFDGPHPSLAREMEWARRHPDITTYNLYEIAYFSRFNKDGRFEGSPAIAELVRSFWNK
ncbi:hypothetical protein ACFLQL_03970, partial [Verrucomicrobiota bacterium]